MTLKEFKEILGKAEEHYPIVDSFVKDYQQSSKSREGYIYNARKENITIDRLSGEPNQKWHFFESYLKNSKYEDWMEANSIYNKIKCPELLLWIAEAVGVDKETVENAAKEAAEIINDGENGWARSRAGEMIRKKYLSWSVLEKEMRR